MAKKASTRKAKAKTIRPERPEVVVHKADSLSDAAILAMRKRVNIERSVEDMEVVGLPIPSLMLQYVLGINVFPLSRILQIVGMEGSCKSSFLYELMRWFAFYGGVCTLAENENKDAKELRHAIMQHQPGLIRRIEVIPTRCVEEWQTVFTRSTQAIKELMSAKGGCGKTFPVLIGVDSIKGTGLRAQIEQVLEDGFASLDFPRMAQVITNYMQTMPDLIGGYPIVLAGTNHLKPGVNTTHGIAVDSVPGGRAIKFMETYEIKLERVSFIQQTTLEGVRLRFTATKSSTGPTRHWGEACFVWTYSSVQVPDPTAPSGEREQLVQHAWWDWYGADIEFLLSFQGEARKNKSLGRRINDIVDLTILKTSRSLGVWSNELGIPESDPLPYSQAGQLLAGRPDLLQRLRTCLGIVERAVFQHGVDYAMQVRAAQEAAAAKAQETVGDVSQLPAPDVSTEEE